MAFISNKSSVTKLIRASAVILGLAIGGCGGGGGSPGTVSGVAASTTSPNDPASISLVFSNPELKSAGIAGSEVTVTAVVKNATNVALAGSAVSFTADSGTLSTIDTVSDKNGQAKALLGTSGDHTNRTIMVTALAGAKTASGTVNVVGTSMVTVGPGTIPAGGTGDFTVTVVDSANVAVAKVPVTFASKTGNAVAVKTSGGGTATVPLTNAQGQIVLTVTASQSGTDTLSISAQGTNTTSSINVNASKLTLSIVDPATGSSVATAGTGTSCEKIAAHYELAGVPQAGIINISTSRGKIYSDSACLTAQPTSSVPLVAGDAQLTYLKSDTAGVATVTASVVGGPSAQANVEFIAALTSAATISLQVEPAIIGTNIGTATTEKSTLTAVVRDGTAINNFVKNAAVVFSIVSDQSGGTLLDPAVATTGSNGAASAIFVAGAASTPNDGVVIQAQIQGTSTTATISMTVSKKSLFISAGTGNTLLTPDSSTYQLDYTVFVTDASGNPVSGVKVTASVVPTRYFKGSYSIVAGAWKQTASSTCLNEDVNHNGILDPAEDTNLNGKLDPGIPLNVSSSGTTDASGTAKVSILYPRDHGNWLEVQMTIRGSVAGTESTYQGAAFVLPVLASDMSSPTISPPGQTSPYGVNACNIAN